MIIEALTKIMSSSVTMLSLRDFFPFITDFWVICVFRLPPADSQ